MIGKITILYGLDFLAELYLIIIMWKNVHWSIALLMTLTRFGALMNCWSKGLNE
jgi:hypothetical protein